MLSTPSFNQCPVDAARLSQLVQTFSKSPQSLTRYDIENIVELGLFLISGNTLVIAPGPTRAPSSPSNITAQDKIYFILRDSDLIQRHNIEIEREPITHISTSYLVNVSMHDIKFEKNIGEAFATLRNDPNNEIQNWFNWVRSRKIEGKTALQEHVNRNRSVIHGRETGTIFTKEHTNFLSKILHMEPALLNDLNLTSESFADEIIQKNSLSNRDLLMMDLYIYSTLIRGKLHEISCGLMGQLAGAPQELLPHPLRKALKTSDGSIATRSSSPIQMGNVLSYISKIIAAAAFSEQDTFARATRWAECIRQAIPRYKNRRHEMQLENPNDAIKSAKEFIFDCNIFDKNTKYTPKIESLLDNFFSITGGLIGGFLATKFVLESPPEVNIPISALLGTFATDYLLKYKSVPKIHEFVQNLETSRELNKIESLIIHGKWDHF